jgi:arylsulfatase
MKQRQIVAAFGLTLFVASLGAISAPARAAEGEIIHDAEYTILEAQNGESWRKEGQAIEARLAEIREKNGGKPPNIIYILLDDVGFGEIGMPELSVIRGYNPRL